MMRQQAAKPYLMAVIAAALAAALAACEQSPATPATVPEHTHETHKVLGPFSITSQDWDTRNGKTLLATLQKGQHVVEARIEEDLGWVALPYLFRFSDTSQGYLDYAVQNDKVYVSCWRLLVSSNRACALAGTKRFQVLVST